MALIREMVFNQDVVLFVTLKYSKNPHIRTAVFFKAGVVIILDVK